MNLSRGEAIEEQHILLANKQVIIKRKDMETGTTRLRRFNNITVLSEFILLRIFNPVAGNVLQQPL